MMRTLFVLLFVSTSLFSQGCQTNPPSIGNDTQSSPEMKTTDSAPSGQADSDTVDTTEHPDSGTLEPEGTCPWFCAQFTGDNTCSDDLSPPSAIHNPNFECDSPDRICCQPLNAPDGLTKHCNDQEGYSCQNECEGTYALPSSKFFCTKASAICCQNTKPGCTQLGGVCKNIWENCPGDFEEQDFNCSLGTQCCLPPACPWDCKKKVGPNTCSENINPPEAIRNDEWMCPFTDQICCQPVEAEGGIEDYCNDQDSMQCDTSCAGYEARRSNFYCKQSNAICCEDMRVPCADINGTCNGMWMCPDGTQQNGGGVCDGATDACCTTIDPDNNCELNGGSCVDWGENCPTLMVPGVATSCGTLSQMCCNWIWG